MFAHAGLRLSSRHNYDASAGHAVAQIAEPAVNVGMAAIRAAPVALPSASFRRVAICSSDHAQGGSRVIAEAHRLADVNA
jgi:hypothetical protein